MLAVKAAGVRHPRHFHCDGNIHIIIANTLFCVHGSMLAKQSSFFQNMFKDGQPLEGESVAEAKPVPFPGLSVREFELILDVLYWIHPGPQLSVYDHLLLLQLSDKFDMATMKNFALEKLDKRKIPPILRLQYGVKCNIADWVETAYEQLLRLPLHRIPTSHLILVDGALLLDVVRTKSACDEFRRNMFLDLPTLVHDADCRSPEACTATWKMAFRTGFCASYLNTDPTNYMTAVDATLAFRDVSVPSMRYQCLQLTKDYIILSGVFREEDEIIQSAIQAGLGRGSTEPLPNEEETALLMQYAQQQ
ncbi:hypothetical protein AURDEDRAFT_189084 [Auricularia subglabra TFB-10046 SS5]|uniref:BTB domain-containing protein n=1 Tax=Auricularia subglabra (strain TFB-10046 / SS5) TaxID=717982 RepID=J0WLY0_AURST|nr:hypothetical protein AURDEDRAFT_189084 [Auricularia subglabra TFB-10046 SS5]